MPRPFGAIGRGLALAAGVFVAPLPLSQDAVGSVSGTVVDGRTGTPVAPAIVLISPGTTNSREKKTIKVTAEGDGTFTVTGMAPGRYWIRAEANGYRTGVFGQVRSKDLGSTLDVNANSAKSGLRLPVWRLGSVRGNVVGRDQRPMAGKRIRLLRQKNGASVQPAGNATTKEDGSFEITRVPAGSYLIAVEGTSGAGIKDSAQTFFYPDATNPRTALAVQVEDSVDNLPVELREPDTPTHSVTGSIKSPLGQESNVDVVLEFSDGNSPIGGVPSLRTKTRPDGSFVFPAVQNGQFVVTATVFPKWPDETIGRKASDSVAKTSRSSQPIAPLPSGATLWGHSLINISNEPVKVVVDLQPGFSISGRLIFNGTAVPPTAAQFLSKAVHISPVGATYSGVFPAGRVEADMTFRLAAMPEGRYMLGMQAEAFPGWTIGSVLLGGKEVNGQAFALFADVKDAVITLVDRPTSVSGRVSYSGATRPLDMAVIAFSVEQRWDEVTDLGGQVARMPLNAEMTFDLVGMPAGRYWIVAVGGKLPEDWKDTKFLRSLIPLAKSVDISPGRQKSQSLELQIIR